MYPKKKKISRRTKSGAVSRAWSRLSRRAGARPERERRRKGAFA